MASYPAHIRPTPLGPFSALGGIPLCDGKPTPGFEPGTPSLRGQSDVPRRSPECPDSGIPAGSVGGRDQAENDGARSEPACTRPTLSDGYPGGFPSDDMVEAYYARAELDEQRRRA